MPALDNFYTGFEVSADCKTITVTIKYDPANCDPELTFEVFNNTTSESVVFYPNVCSDTTNGVGTPVPFYNDFTGNYWTAYITAEDLGIASFTGVLTLMNYDPNAEIDYPYELYAVGLCELDCCIASLVQDAIDCTCKCGKCSEDLHTAEKVHLLATSAVYSATNLDVVDAISKYNKAKDFCTASCACGC